MAIGSIHIKTAFDKATGVVDVQNAFKAIQSSIKEVGEAIQTAFSGIGVGLTSKIKAGINTQEIASHINTTFGHIDASVFTNKINDSISNIDIKNKIETALSGVDTGVFANKMKLVFDAVGFTEMRAEMGKTAVAMESVVESLSRINSLVGRMDFDTKGLESLNTYSAKLKEVLSSLGTFQKKSMQNLLQLSNDFKQIFDTLTSFAAHFKEAFEAGNISGAVEMYREMMMAFSELVISMEVMSQRMTGSLKPVQEILPAVKGTLRAFSTEISAFIKKFSDEMGANRFPEFVELLKNFGIAMEGTATFVSTASDKMVSAFNSIGERGTILKKILRYTATALNQLGKNLTDDAKSSMVAIGELTKFIDALSNVSKKLSDNMAMVLVALNNFAAHMPKIESDAEALKNLGDAIRATAQAMALLAKLDFRGLQGSEEIRNTLSLITGSLESFAAAMNVTFGEQSASAIKGLAALFQSFGGVIETVSAKVVDANRAIIQKNAKTGETVDRLQAIFSSLGVAVAEFAEKTKGSMDSLPQAFNAITALVTALSQAQTGLAENTDILISAMKRLSNEMPELTGDPKMIAAIGTYVEKVGKAISATSEFAKQAKDNVSGVDKAISSSTEQVEKFVEVLAKGVSPENVAGINAISNAFSTLADLITSLSRDLGSAFDNMTDKKKMFSTVIGETKNALISLSQASIPGIEKLSALFVSLSQYINALSRVTVEFSSKTDILSASLLKVSEIMPKTFDDAESLRAINSFISKITGLGDAVRNVANLTEPEIAKFNSNLLKIVPVSVQVSRSIHNIGRSAEHTTSKFAGMSNIMRYIFMGGGIYYLVRQMRQFINSTLQEFNDLMTSMISFKAITGATSHVLSELSSNINRAARDFGYAQSEIAKASVALAKAGLEGEQVSKSVYSISSLARAALEDVSQATKVATTIMVAFNKDASEMVNIANTLTGALLNSKLELKDIATQLNYTAATSNAAGIEFQDLSAALATMSNAGIQASQVGTSLRGIIGLLLAPTGRFAAMLQSLGVSAEDVNPKLNSLVQIMRTLADAGLTVDKVYASLDKRVAQGMTALVSQVDQLEEMERKLIGSATAYEIGVVQMDSFTAAMASMAAAIQANLYPSILSIKEFGVDVANAISRIEEKTKLFSTSLKLLGGALSILVGVALKNWVVKLYHTETALKTIVALKSKLLTLIHLSTAGTIRQTIANAANVVQLKLTSYWTVACTTATKLFNFSQIALGGTIKGQILNLKFLSLGMRHLTITIAGISKALVLLAVKFAAISAIVFSLYEVGKAMLGIEKAIMSTSTAYSNLRAATDITNKRLKEQNQLLSDGEISYKEYTTRLRAFSNELESLNIHGSYIAIARSLRDVSDGTDEYMDKITKLGKVQAILSTSGAEEHFSGVYDIVERFERSGVIGGITESFLKISDSLARMVGIDTSGFFNGLKVYTNLLVYPFEKVAEGIGNATKTILGFVGIDIRGSAVSSAASIGLINEETARLQRLMKELSSLPDEMQQDIQNMADQYIGNANKMSVALQEVVDREYQILQVQIMRGNVDVDRVKNFANLIQAQERYNDSSFAQTLLDLDKARATQEIIDKLREQAEISESMDMQRRASLIVIGNLFTEGELSAESYLATIQRINAEEDKRKSTLQDSMTTAVQMLNAIASGQPVALAMYGNVVKANSMIISTLDKVQQEMLGLPFTTNQEIINISNVSRKELQSLSLSVGTVIKLSEEFGLSQKNMVRDISEMVRHSFIPVLEQQKETLSESGLLTKSLSERFEHMFTFLNQSVSESLSGFLSMDLQIGQIADRLVDMYGADSIELFKDLTTESLLLDRIERTTRALQDHASGISTLSTETAKAFEKQALEAGRTLATLRQIDARKKDSIDATRRANDAELSSRRMLSSVEQRINNLQRQREQGRIDEKRYEQDMARLRREQDSRQEDVKHQQDKVKFQERITALYDLQARYSKNSLENINTEGMTAEQIVKYVEDQLQLREAIVRETAALNKEIELADAASTRSFYNQKMDLQDIDKEWSGISDSVEGYSNLLQQARASMKAQEDILFNMGEIFGKIELHLASMVNLPKEMVSALSDAGESAIGLQRGMSGANDEGEEYVSVMESANALLNSQIQLWESISKGIQNAVSALRSYNSEMQSGGGATASTMPGGGFTNGGGANSVSVQGMTDYQPTTINRLISGFDKVMSRFVPQPNQIPQFATGGVADKGSFQMGSDHRPVNIYLDGTEYRMYSDGEVASKLIRAMKNRNKTRKF